MDIYNEILLFFAIINFFIAIFLYETLTIGNKKDYKVALPCTIGGIAFLIYGFIY